MYHVTHMNESITHMNKWYHGYASSHPRDFRKDLSGDPPPSRSLPLTGENGDGWDSVTVCWDDGEQMQVQLSLIHVYIRIYVYAFVCKYIYTHTHTHHPLGWWWTNAGVHFWIIMYPHTMYPHICTHSLIFIHEHICIYSHTHIHTYIYIYIYIFKFIYSYTHMFIHVCTYVRIHIYIYIYIHSDLYILTYVYMCKSTYMHIYVYTYNWYFLLFRCVRGNLREVKITTKTQYQELLTQSSVYVRPLWARGEEDSGQRKWPWPMVLQPMGHTETVPILSRDNAVVWLSQFWIKTCLRVSCGLGFKITCCSLHF